MKNKNSFYIIKEGLKAGLSINEITKAVLEHYPRSPLKVIQKLIKETKLIMPDAKPISSSSKIQTTTIKVSFRDADKQLRTWEFDHLDISECKKALREGLDERQIAIRICCPRECVPKLIEEIMRREKVGRNRNGNNKSENKRRRRTPRKHRSYHI